MPVFIRVHTPPCGDQKPALGVLSFEASSLPKPGLHQLCPMPGRPSLSLPPQCCGCKHAENPHLVKWVLASALSSLFAR